MFQLRFYDSFNKTFDISRQDSQLPKLVTIYIVANFDIQEFKIRSKINLCPFVGGVDD